MAHSPPTIRDQSMIDPPCVICTQPVDASKDHAIVRRLMDLESKQGRAHIACYNRRYGSLTICRACQDREAIRYDLSYLELDGTYTPLPLCDRCHRIGMGMSVYGTEPGDADARGMLLEQTERQKSPAYRSTFPSAAAPVDADPATTSFLPVRDSEVNGTEWEYDTRHADRRGLKVRTEDVVIQFNPNDEIEVSR